jgi:sulfur relay protein TusB/DsrH
MKYLIWLSSDCANLKEIVDALRANENDIGLLLIQDGVFMVDRGCPNSKELLTMNLPFYASKNHVEERGIGDRLLDGVKLVDYPEIVNIIMEEYDKVISF